MKYVIILIIACYSFCTGAEKTIKNNDVRFSISLKEKSIKPGENGTLRIILKPREGIHINLNPPMSVQIDSNRTFALSGPINAPKNSSNAGYYNAGKPIEQQFTVTATARPGKITLTGVFSYFYCSDAQGWCSKFKQPFDVAVTIVK